MALTYHILLIGHILSAVTGFLLSVLLAVMTWQQRKAPALNERFWRWQTATQGITVILGAFGVGLFLLGHRPRVIWHLLYGALALLTVLLQRALAPGQATRQAIAQDYGRFSEAWVYFGLNLFLLAMYGRGLSTGFFGL